MRTEPIVVSFRVSRKEAKWIDHYARKAGKGRGGWVRQLARDALIELAQKEKAS